MAFSLVELLSIFCVLGLPFAYETSSSFRYYLKFFVYYAFVMMVAVVLIPILALRAWDVRNLQSAGNLDVWEQPRKTKYLYTVGCVAMNLILLLECVAGCSALLLVSKAARYYAKFCVYLLWITVVPTALFPYHCLVRPFSYLNVPLCARFGKLVTKLIGVQWRVKNGHYLAEQKASVVVSNHQTSLDLLGMLQIWEMMQRCTVIVKKELFYLWPFGVAIWLCGIIFIDRKSPEKARDAMDIAALKIKADKAKLWVYPEGTRRNTGEIHEFKKGAFCTAITAQLPIQPVVFSPYYFLSAKSHTFDSGKVIMSALPPISTEGLTLNDVNDLITKVRTQMKDEYARLSEEVKASSICLEKKY